MGEGGGRVGGSVSVGVKILACAFVQTNGERKKCGKQRVIYVLKHRDIEPF